MSFACSCVAHRLLCTCPSRALFLARLLFNFMNTPAQTLYLHRVNLMRSFFAMKNLWHTLVGFALQTLLIVQNKMREPTAFAQFHAYIAHSPWTCVFIILIFLLTSNLAHSFCALIHQSSFKCGCSLSLTLHVFMCVRYRIFWLHLSLKLFLLLLLWPSHSVSDSLIAGCRLSLWHCSFSYSFSVCVCARVLFLLFLNFKIHVVIGGVVLYDVIFRVCVSVAFYGLFDALIYGLNRMLHENTQTHRHTCGRVCCFCLSVSLPCSHSCFSSSLYRFADVWVVACVCLLDSLRFKFSFGR